MLFNSYPFLLLFMPVALIGYVLIGRTLGRGAVFGWLVAASLFFYGWWNWWNLSLLLSSIVLNYGAGTWLGRIEKGRGAKLLLGVVVALNLGFLGYFKYVNFFIENINALFRTHWAFAEVVLPLGISFYTFQIIAYLVDSYHGQTRGYGFRDFCLFVSFFPQLIAGPIVHHGEMMPQFRRHEHGRTHWDDWSVGLTLFIAGLAKKVLIADPMATFATPIFRVARNGAEFGLAEAWGGVLAYTLQLYFDFSAYSDMAIGLARLFGVRLPINFNSPYKARNIADFWRRWHITLSRFLRDYLYIPLGGNRRGPARKYVNLFITMLLGGIWHGAGWTFVIWGALHGIYLALFHAWRDRSGAKAARSETWWRMLGSRGLTFFLVVIAWVFFRADNLQAAWSLLSSMTGMYGFHSNLARVDLDQLWIRVGLLLLVVWFLPNTYEIMARFRPVLEPMAGNAEPGHAETPRSVWWRWQPKKAWAFCAAAVLVAAVLGMSRATEFIYWQF